MNQQGLEQVITQRVEAARVRWERDRAVGSRRLAEELRRGIAGQQVIRGPAAEFSLTLEPEVLADHPVTAASQTTKWQRLSGISVSAIHAMNSLPAAEACLIDKRLRILVAEAEHFSPRRSVTDRRTRWMVGKPGG
jgi:hypothetical protein